jgi:hypothetical protein
MLNQERFDRQAAEWDTPARVALADAVAAAMITAVMPRAGVRVA